MNTRMYPRQLSEAFPAAATGADVADMARSLLNRMADAYSHYNAEEAA